MERYLTITKSDNCIMNTATLAELMETPSEIRTNGEKTKAHLESILEDPFLQWAESSRKRIQEKLKELEPENGFDDETQRLFVSYFSNYKRIQKLKQNVKEIIKTVYGVYLSRRHTFSPEKDFFGLLKLYDLHLKAIESAQFDLHGAKLMLTTNLNTKNFRYFMRNVEVIVGHLHSYASEIAEQIFYHNLGDRNSKLEWAFRWYAHAHVSADIDSKLGARTTLHRASRYRNRGKAAYELHILLGTSPIEEPKSEWQKEISLKDWYSVAQGCYTKALNIADEMLNLPTNGESRRKVIDFRRITLNQYNSI